jgi:2,4-dienoyl-CoA reductase-like NADH-dependent reductase (Old Yellow Enzyme family)
MLTEGTLVCADGHAYPNTPGIYTDEQMAGWKPIVKAVKDKGAVFFCQLWHCGRASHRAYQEGGAHLFLVRWLRVSGHSVMRRLAMLAMRACCLPRWLCVAAPPFPAASRCAA